VIAPSFGEIFYSNAMQTACWRLMLPEAPARELMRRVLATPGSGVRIDLAAQRVACGPVEAGFDMAPRHRRMLMEGLDVIGLTLTQREQIEAFARRQAAAQPWLVDVAARARARLDG
jgi:3-isopropylmalate/(R)-2-methylmalate dehydratase small subunit